jgi:hypothetical protein
MRAFLFSERNRPERDVVPLSFLLWPARADGAILLVYDQFVID